MAPVTMSTMTMTMTMAVMHAVTVATVPTMPAMPTMPTMTTVSAAGERRSNRSRGQSESGDGSEGNLAKHSCSPFQARLPDMPVRRARYGESSRDFYEPAFTCDVQHVATF